MWFLHSWEMHFKVHVMWEGLKQAFGGGARTKHLKQSKRSKDDNKSYHLRDWTDVQIPQSPPFMVSFLGPVIDWN